MDDNSPVSDDGKKEGSRTGGWERTGKAMVGLEPSAQEVEKGRETLDHGVQESVAGAGPRLFSSQRETAAAAQLENRRRHETPLPQPEEGSSRYRHK